MNPESQREAALFQAAAQLTSSARATFLDGACHGDAPLRQRLEALLAAHDAEDPFLGPTEPKAGPAQTMKLELSDASDEAIGKTIGRYKLREKVGEGGCGVVYVADQEQPVRRRVALKVIKLGMDTKSVIARFEAERQALAMMDHPNIAKVLDAGTTETGRPFFVMELVRGIRITDYCDQNNLSTKERLDLFIQVCHAIQHAHQKGIIHRDIKPSNILVTLHDGVPIPKVIDFGIAKATEGRLTDATVYTQLHQFIGTPAYMSPEQAEMSGLDIDTRSDIYSLGVLLYELLAGSTPFDGQQLMSMGVDAMRKIIREKEPARPSTKLATLQGDELTTTAKRRSVESSKLVKLMRGDLDWIVMKCLEKDRQRRYDTANGLAMDIKRHLNNEAVIARPPSAAYRFQKSFRRNKFAFAAVGSVAVALLIGIIVSAWQAVRATRAKQEAVAEKQRANRETATANRVTDFMRKMLATAMPDSSKGPGYTVRAMLDDFAPAIDTQFPNNPEVAAELHTVIGRAYSNMQQPAKARTQLARAMELQASVHGTNHENYADSLVQYAGVFDATASAAEAEDCERYLERALAIYRDRGVHGDRVIGALRTLELVYNSEQKYDKVEPLVLAARAEARHSSVTNAFDLIALNDGLAQAKITQRKYAEAETIIRDSIATTTRHFGSDNVQVAWEDQNLCRALLQQGKYAEALEAATNAVAIMRKCVAPEQTWYGHQLLAVLNTLTAARRAQALASLFSSMDQLEWLEALFQERLGSKPLLPGVRYDPANVAISAVPEFPSLYLELATEWSAAGRTNEAAKCHQKALTSLERLQAQNMGDPDTLSKLYLTGIRVSVQQGEPDKATAYREKLLALKQLSVSSLNDVAWTFATEADLGMRDGSNAIVFAEQAVAVTGRTNANYLDTLAAAFAELGKFDKAITTETEAIALLPADNTNRYFAECLSLYQSSIPYRDDQALAGEVAALLQAGKYAEAEQEARTCLALRQKLISDDWRTSNAQSMLGGSLLGQKKYAEAGPLLLSGYNGMKQRADQIPAAYRQIRLKEAIERLMQLYQATGQPAKAAEWEKKLAESKTP